MSASDGDYDLEHEEDHPNDNDDDDDGASSSSSEDENAHLKMLKPSNNNSVNNNITLSIRRNDSYTSFLTRSERAAARGKDPPPPQTEVSQRRVQFVDDHALEHVHEIEIIPPEERASVYMTQSDFERAETEMKITLFRWENHQNGHIPFDEDNNSIRGLEHLWDRPGQTKKTLATYKHSRAVLEEIMRQKQDNLGHVRDWESVRQISLQFSVHSHNHAVEVGRQDRDAHERARNSITAKAGENDTAAASAAPVKKKAHKLRFWQKKK